MDQSFSLRSPIGNFDVTPDQDCKMVYIEKHRDKKAPKIEPDDIPSWCFESQTIWFYFGASDSEDKVEAGEKIKSRLIEQLQR